MLKRMDQNGNGVLDDNEVSDRARGFLDRMKERSGYTDKGPINIEKLTAAIKKQSEGAEPATVPGFGESDGLEAAKGFDAPPPYTGMALENKFDQKTIDSVTSMLDRYDKDKNGFLDSYEWSGARWRTPPEGSDLNKDGKLDRLELAKRVSGFSAGGDKDKDDDGGGDRRDSGDKGDVRENAKALLKQHDKNGNGYLEKEEWFKSDLGNYDKNRDGKISTDELASRISSFANRSSFASSRAEDQKVETYRFLSPLERLPKGLPDWFNTNDADEDGQIHMSEYSVVWSDSKAEEFARYDLNGDGFITAKEALGGGSSTSSTSSTSSSRTSSSTASAAPSERSGGPPSRGDRPRSGFGFGRR
ncbi:hypothetical protein M4951_13920 [Blastopirellula sp. J2-11]|uniref:hypothetical protein n=1 Tax=Blastopirellula sp. J2-11 TaxID=2943192 RepID=UPI0021C65B4E|nr:hypothetical protein [Blastopirellula sp. J2-11]UUO04489.1 hypothetical protein M4951_13920 [Blastopirellula sp. J2-11]